MNYPLISEYIEAIKAAEDNFDQLKHLRPVLDDDGLPVMTSGNLAVVFKMKDEQIGKFYAVKCFTKEQEGRAEAYKLITEELAKVDSPYILSISYLETLVVLSIIALVICALTWLISCVLVTKTIEYFGLQKSYIVVTILSTIIAPLMIIFLLLVLSGFIPSIFDPRFL